MMSVIECYVNGVLQTDGVSGATCNSVEEEVEKEEPEIKSEFHHSNKHRTEHNKDINFPSISSTGNVFLDESFEKKYTDEKLEMIEKKRKESINPRVQHSNTTEFNSVLSFFKTLERKKHK